ncbi:AAA family ATPase [Candidatus Palauibacter sp.]|uniref:AAA family ATPase n=1 Tax=Candidatus Palauibacter sp. TaxID=3101350 RepID=UPI003B5B431E
MIKRFYADNFRCLTNFELELDETNIFLGANGSGKSSVLDVLWKIQRLVVGGAKLDEVFFQRDLSFAQTSDDQRFELDLCVDERDYEYRLIVEHDRKHNQMRIEEEVLKC